MAEGGIGNASNCFHPSSFRLHPSVLRSLDEFSHESSGGFVGMADREQSSFDLFFGVVATGFALRQTGERED